jgi:hypothetical protein
MSELEGWQAGTPTQSATDQLDQMRLDADVTPNILVSEEPLGMDLDESPSEDFTMHL